MGARRLPDPADLPADMSAPSHSTVDVKGNDVDAKGNCADVKGAEEGSPLTAASKRLEAAAELTGALSKGGGLSGVGSPRIAERAQALWDAERSALEQQVLNPYQTPAKLTKPLLN